MNNEPAFQTGRALWEGDVGVSDVSAAWAKLFGEPFDKTKAVERSDLGDAIGYLMPGGYVVYDETYETNHGIYAPPRKAPEGAVWGLRVAPREDPVVCPILLPPDFVLFDPVRRAYRHKDNQGERHCHTSRRFMSGDWYGLIYVLSGDERTAEREKHHFQRTTEEAALDALKSWYDRGLSDRDFDLTRAIERWYFKSNRACTECGAVGRVHPTYIDLDCKIDGRKYHVRDVPVTMCGECRKWTAGVDDLMRADREASARALRAYPATGKSLKHGRKALGKRVFDVVIETAFYGICIEKWERGTEAPDPAYVRWLIDKLEET